MYQCSNPECGKQFMHTAKLIENGLMDGKVRIIADGSIESLVCPFCQSKAYTEVAEEKQAGTIKLEDIAKLIDCSPGEANNYLVQGYVLFQTWQKNVFLVKLKEKPAPAGESLAEMIAKVKYGSATKDANPAEANPTVYPCPMPHEPVYRGCTNQCTSWNDCVADLRIQQMSTNEEKKERLAKRKTIYEQAPTEAKL
jgi:hypothetical protein